MGEVLLLSANCKGIDVGPQLYLQAPTANTETNLGKEPTEGEIAIELRSKGKQ